MKDHFCGLFLRFLPPIKRHSPSISYILTEGTETTLLIVAYFPEDQMGVLRMHNGRKILSHILVNSRINLCGFCFYKSFTGNMLIQFNIPV